MRTIPWDESLRVGIDRIDQQHQQLIDQLNLLMIALQENKAKSEIERIINFLDQYIDQHFGFEENCMNAYQCPVACENKKAHHYFRQTFEEIKHQFRQEGASLSLVLKVNRNLLDWFINHIRKIDMQLKPYISP
ncbi:hemerythrin family protein [Phormidium yuhuli AB48]|uniref:Hemerythrin family protein n=1 Tax=Phormidium yuhuli AB48 TaxID=2940671 RepID=A0ABY5ASC9_9CYAN|nr:hemerythrin family protein [Phormidium yuhuli]USR91765.1 hemerythrin family protein [Phormidium yuhuli AB48]